MIEYLLWLRCFRSAKVPTGLGEPWCIAHQVVSDATPWEGVAAAEVLAVDGVFTSTITLRAMCIRIVGYGWKFQRADCDDLEDLYRNLAECLTTGSAKTANKDVAGPRGQEGTARLPQSDEATRGWRGKLSWRDRLKPQWHDDE